MLLMGTLVSTIQGLYMYHRCGAKHSDESWLIWMLVISLGLVASSAMSQGMGKGMSSKAGMLLLSIVFLATAAVTNKLGNKCGLSQGTAQWMSVNTAAAVLSVVTSLYRIIH